MIRSFHGLHIMPVGWGYSSLHIAYFDERESAIVTDGGALHRCLREVVQNQYHLVSVLGRTIKHSYPLVWIISHFDYDHISLTAQVLRQTSTYAEICIIPFTYSTRTCREVLSQYLAFMMYEARLYVKRVPALPEVLETIPGRCRKVLLAKRGSRLCINDNMCYEFIWPDPNYINMNVCEKIQEELGKKLEGLYERDPQAREEINRLVDGIRRKLNTIGDSELLEELNLEEFISLEKDVQERSMEETLTDIFIEREAIKPFMDLGERSLRILSMYKLREVKDRLENVFSLAYILRSWRPEYYTILESNDVDASYIRFWHSDDVMVFLGDLDNSAIGIALNSYVPIHVAVLIPAHHGNRWHNVLRHVAAKITYLNRCHRHTPRSYMGGLKSGYIHISELAVMAGHKYYLHGRF